MKKSVQLLTALVAASVFGIFIVAEAASVTGTISAKGGAPKAIKITKDEAVCGKKPLFVETLLVSKGGGLQNAVVEILGAGEGKPGKANLAQHGCRFEPHVIAITAETSVTLANKDGIMHNFHSLGFENEGANFSQPGEIKTKVISGEKFEAPEVVKIQCDVHEWMNGWVYVTESAHFAVTDAKGNFKIDNVPAGSYTVKIWHELLAGDGIEKKLVVKDGANSFNHKF